ncbi:MAG: serine/threonine-protein kinase, partial [Alphaproteobacteria bacterium]
MALIMGSAFSMRGKPPVDERVVSHFRLVEALGSGSMGRVYKAWDLRLNRWVALKFLPPQLADDAKACARFRREAEAASSLEHGHICSIFDVDKDETGDTFLVMAWYDGETLAKKLEAGPVRPDLALKYARQIALGLAAAHRQGIVHRDIKPANVIITWDDEAVILDFGVAYLMDQTRLSQPGGHSGTLAYMAPEQFSGSEPDSAMDIWSLGVLLYEMLTGGLPFRGDYTPALTYAIAHEDPLPLPDDLTEAIPDARKVVDRCLAKQPQDRYSSAADLATDLTVLSNESPAGLAATRPTFRLAGRWRRRTALAVAALVLVGVGIIAGMTGLIGSPGSHRPGVAVLPFVVKKDGEIQREFGEGLAWLLANRLGHLAGLSDEFWIVPPEDVLLYEIRDPDAAKDQLGVDRTISGMGTISGSNLSLHLEYLDAVGEAPVTREFFDDLANLPTWQSGLMAWSLAQLDPDRDSAAAPVFARGSTQVPEALYAFLEGIAWSRRHPGYDQDLKKSYGDQAFSAF